MRTRVQPLELTEKPGHAYDPSTGEADRQVPGAHWPATLVSVGNSRPVRDPVSQNKVGSFRGITCKVDLFLHIYEYMHVYAHIPIHTYVSAFIQAYATHAHT